MCDHHEFHAVVTTNRLADSQDGDSIRLMVELSVTCTQCEKPLCFALPLGLNLVSGATMSPDGTEARLTARIGIPKEPQIHGFDVIHTPANESLL